MNCVEINPTVRLIAGFHLNTIGTYLTSDTSVFLNTPVIHMITGAHLNALPNEVLGKRELVFNALYF